MKYDPSAAEETVEHVCLVTHGFVVAQGFAFLELSRLITIPSGNLRDI